MADSKHSDPSVSEQSAGRILVVDDNPVALFSTTSILREAGFTVLEAVTGREGLRLARLERPAFVFLDVVLPDLSGIEVCRALKADPELASTFVVFLSAREIDSDKQARGLDAGADGYIARPIGRRELLARVHAMLRIRSAEQALRRAQAELETRVKERTLELAEANGRLRALSLRVLEVQENERRFLAHELHDEIGQALTFLKLSLEWAERKGTTGGLAEARQTLDDLMQRVRKLSLDLRPHILDDLGLEAALQWHFKRYTAQTQITVDFNHSPVPRGLSTQLQTNLFRIVQEALTNAARYAQTTLVLVRLWFESEECQLEIEDHGTGFDPAAVPQHASNGLTGMRERALLLGGSCRIESALGHGTRITVELPIEAAEAETGGSKSVG